MKSFYESLEFKKVLEIVNGYSKTEVGSELVLSSKIHSNPISLNDDLNLLKEMMSLVQRYNELPICNSSNLLKIIELANKFGILSVYDLEKVAQDIIIIKKLLSEFNKIKDEYPLLTKIMNDFVDLTNLESLIHSVISPNLSIYDNASNELNRIRRSLTNLENDLANKVKLLVKTYGDYLIDNNVTIRNGHYVLPVRVMYKFKVDGIIHDTSDSGNTVFIEPASIVELNNKIAVLKIEEQDEISRILRKLTESVLKEEEHIINNNKLLGQIDFLNAKTKYACDYNGVVANISEERELRLNGARHPLLSQNNVVPNDFLLSQDKHILIISGPNAGGKSVALKTVGLLVVMHQSGYPILANDGAVIPFFKRIYVDIGDQQSLNDSLSTFSAHMQNLIDMSKKLGMKDLVIFDELGTGTDPQEGEALAKSVLDYLHFKQAFSLISSHFMGVKTYALNKEYVMNASMIFDEKNFLPTYQMRLGMPGKSYGMEVAKRLGLDNNIIEKAQKYLKEDNNNLFSSSLSKLDALVNEYETKMKKIDDEQKKLVKDSKDLAAQLVEFNNKKSHLLEEVEEEKEQMLLETQEKIDEILHSLNKEEIKMHEVIKAKKDLTDLMEEKSIHNESNEIFDINDYVQIIDMNLNGTIKQINNGKYKVQTALGYVIVNKNEITKISRPIEKKKTSMTMTDRHIISRSVPLELNLIGMHADEALISLEKYLDDVIIKGYQEVRIIHGSGTGVLRKVVHDYLSKQKFIKSYRLGGMGEGGVGATVVYLK